ncbi:Protein kinase domain [Melia azedarach]|uniref:Protein kinase domain n=1 Tax=Melia azedarach TaxID=155640 RepID=A0ACC1XMA4_MELAZ|nr:Protein kinase domain [Melia azedarach]
MTEADSTSLALGREIIIPISCSCTGQFSKAIVKYNFSTSGSFAGVACGAFEGLVKAQSLVDENTDFEGNVLIKVPIRCACPNEDDRSNDVNYLVTYPVIEDDNTDLIARKFGIQEEMIWKANGLQSFDSIFPKTTVLMPTKDVPVVDWDIETRSDDPALSPRGVIPLTKVVSSTETTVSLKPQVLLALGVVVAVVLIIVASCVCISIRRKYRPRSFRPLTPRNSVSSNLSPDFLDGVSKLKHSLISFSLEELRIATEDFNESTVIGTAVYRGRIGSLYVAIERMNSVEAARHVICILTKMNHLNVVRLEGCCYGSTPYLVFEFAQNGSLRECLTSAPISRQLTWAKRLQIAFDLAVAIHYIHYCTKPAYVHRNINSRNVLITKDWRAKISGFRLAKSVIFNEEKEQTNWNESVVVGRKGYLAPEYLSDGLASLKVDVFAYGVILLELLSSKEATMEGKLLKDSVNFLVDAGFESSSGSLNKLKEFLDPALEGDYPIGDAMCLTILAKACIEEDPHNRPTMNDVLKALSRIV